MSIFLRRLGLLLGLFVLFSSSGAWAQTLGVSISAAPNPVLQGQQVTLDVVVQNTDRGNNTLTNISRTVSGLPTGLVQGSTIIFGGLDAASAVYNVGTGNVTFRNDPSSASNKASTASRTTTIRFSPTAGFIARISATSTANPATAQVTVTVTPVADVSTTLTAPVPNTFLNSAPTGNFTVTYTNNGPSTAPSVTRTVVPSAAVTNVFVNDVAASGTSGSVTFPGVTGVSYNFSTNIFDFGTQTSQTSGSTNSFTFRYTTPATGTSITTTSNTAVSGTPATTDPNTATSGTNNNTAAVVTTLSGSAVDVQTTIAQTLPTGTTAPAGGFVTYTVTISNLSATTAATNVFAFVDVTPTTLTDVSSSKQGAYSNGTVTFPVITSLAANSSVTRLVRVRIPLTGVSTTTATARSTSDNDNVLGNNNGTAANAKATTTVVQEADIAVTVNGPAQTLANGSMTYNVLVTNNGPSNATGVTAQLAFSTYTPGSVTVTGGTYNSYAGGIITFNIPGGAIAAGTAVPFTVRFNAPASGGSVTATVKTVSATISTDTYAGNNDGTRADAKVTTTVFATLPQTVCAPPLTAASDFTYDGTTSINTYYAGQGAAATGQKVVTVDAVNFLPTTGTPLANGDLVLIMQMQGATIDATNTNSYGDGASGDPASGQTAATAGQYEYGIISTISGNTITLTNNLVNTYTTAAATPTAGQQLFQVVRVPQYRTLTLNANVSNVEAWDGKVGGVFVADVAGTFNLNGKTIDLKGRGFRGGAGRQLTGTGAGTTMPSDAYRSLSTINTNGSKGEGIAGTPRYVNNGGVLLDNATEGYPNGDNSRGAPGNAGGGGTDPNPSANDQNTGGGGGSNAGFGGRGGDGWDSSLPYGGEGGSPFLLSAPSRVIMGGGAGAGTTNNGTGAQAAGFASSGAGGGGVALIRANQIANAGTIDVSGADMTYVPANDGSGGGGAGGTVVLISSNSLSSVIVLATGGKGGSNTGGNAPQVPAPHGPGGGGSGGLAFLSSPVSNSSSFVAGANGVTLSNTANPIAYGATPGTTSTPPYRVDVTVPETPLIQASANCVANLSTTIIGPANAGASVAAGPYSVTFTNNGYASGGFATRNVTLPTGATLTQAQKDAITAQVPGATFTITGTGATAVTTIVFGALASVPSGTTNRYSFSFTAPASGTGLSLTSSVTPDATTNEGGITADNTATLPITLFTAPIAQNVTNAAIVSNNGPVTLSAGLSGTATSPATIVSYTIISLPTSGTLTYNGTVLTSANIASTVITDRTQLIYTPVSTFSGTATFTYTVTDSNGITSGTNQTGAAAATAGPATYSIPVTLGVDVTVSLTGAATLNPGQPTGTYTATFTNEGPGTASSVSRLITLPAGATLTQAQKDALTAAYGTTAFGTDGTGAVTITFPSVGSLVANGTSVVSFAFTAPTTAGNSTLRAATSTTSSQGANFAPDQTSLTLTTTTLADVAATISGAATLVSGVPTATFTVSFSNLSTATQTAAGVTRTVQLPKGLTGVTVSGADAGSYDATTGIVTYTTTSPTTLASGASLNSVITFAYPLGTRPVATATVSTTSSEGGQTANNTATATLPVTYDLATTITGPIAAVAGSPMTLYVTTTNNGPTTAPAGTQTVTIPSDAVLTNLFITNGGTYSYNSTTKIGTVTFPNPLNQTGDPITVSNLRVGQTVVNSISFVAPASFDVTGTTAGTPKAPYATVTSNATTGTETNTANNVAYLNGGTTATALMVNAATTVLANEAIAISADNTIVVPNAIVTYIVTTTNKGTGTATDVVQQIQLLPALSTATVKVGGMTGTVNTTDATLIDFGSGATKSTYDTKTGVLTLATVASQLPNTTLPLTTIAVTMPASAGNAGQVVTTATVRSSTSDNVPADNIADVAVKVNAADLVAAISGPATLAAGQTATYTASFSNSGPGTAIGAVETAQLPAGLSNVVVKDANGVIIANAYNSATGLVSFGTIASDAVGQTQSFTISFVSLGQTFPVSSAITSNTNDVSAANNSATMTTTALTNADVATSVSGPATAVIGNQLTYTVTTTNNGPSPAPAATQTLDISSDAALTNLVISNGGTYAYNLTTKVGTVTFSAVSLPAGGSAVNTVSFIMPTATSGLLSALATVTSSVNDAVVTNNTVAQTTSVAPATTEVADLVATITPTGTTVTAGNTVSYTLGYRNANATDGATATNVVPTASLPTGLSAATLQVGGSTGTLSTTVITFPNGAKYDTMTGLLTFATLATLAPSATATSYAVSFPAPGSGPLVVSAQVASATSDNMPANNQQSSSLTITSSYDVVTALAGPTLALSGSTNTYSVTTTNNGPSTTTASTTQTVTVPPNSVVTNLPAGATYVASSGVITFAAIASQPAGTNGEVVNSFSVQMPASGSLALSAAVTSANESNTANNAATLTTTPANQAPVAQNIWNTLQSARSADSGMASATGLPISNLVATDDVSVSKYIIQSLPSASQGTLYYNGVPATVGTQVSSTAVGTSQGLSFVPNSGFVGNATFTYAAIDNDGTPLTGNTALYTIPVAQDQEAVYTVNAAKGGANPYVAGDELARVYDYNTGVATAATIFTANPNSKTSPVNYGSAVVNNGVTSAAISPADAIKLAGIGVKFNATTGQITVGTTTADLALFKKAAGTYTISVTTVDANGGVTLQSVTFTIGALPLPVELTDFTVQAVKNIDAQLSWTTASEKNNDHFDVERSTVGTTFVKIGQVKGQGTSSSPTVYALTDAGIGAKASGQVYYRLKQVDTDGTATYSPVRTLTFTKSATPAISLFPNPATTGTQLDLTQLPTGTYQVSVLDATGRVVLGLTLEAGLAHALDLNTIASGTYMVVVRGQNSGQAILLTKRLIKE